MAARAGVVDDSVNHQQGDTGCDSPGCRRTFVDPMHGQPPPRAMWLDRIGRELDSSRDSYAAVIPPAEDARSGLCHRGRGPPRTVADVLPGSRELMGKEPRHAERAPIGASCCAADARPHRQSCPLATAQIKDD